MVWRGEKPEQRKGCQVCMSASKCPMIQVVKNITQRGEEADLYYSSTPVVGKLKSSILESIFPIIVLDMHVRYIQGVSDAEKIQINAANEAVRSGKKIHREGDSEIAEVKTKRRINEVRVVTPVKEKSIINSDMSESVVNEMMKQEEG
jgi:hypothetical protein